MGSPENDYEPFSAWDNAMFTIGGGLLLLSPVLIVAGLGWLLFF
jgi:hypothetical protein